MKKITLLLFFFLPLFAQAQVIVTAAGCGCVGLGDGGPATAAQLAMPLGIALDDSGNLYICDAVNERIRKVSPGYGGIITTIAGNGTPGYSGDGGLGIYAQLGGVIDVVVDRHGNVYIADQNNHCIRKVTPLDTITTIAGTGTAGYNGDGIPATAAQLGDVSGVTVDNAGNVYIADEQNYRLRMVDTYGIIHTIAGTGVAGFSPDGSRVDTAQINNLNSIRMDNTGNIFFEDNIRIRKIDTAGIITTIAGNGIYGYTGDSGMATAAEIAGGAIAIDMSENLYIADGDYNHVREVNASEGIINTIAGNGMTGFSGDNGPPLLAEFRGTNGVAVDDSGNVYISDQGNNRIRLITKHPLGINNVISQADKINIYPNPCHDYSIIEVSSSIDEQVGVTVCNITGVPLYKFDIVTNRSFTFQITWPPGVYIIHATTAQQQFNEKLVVQ